MIHQLFPWLVGATRREASCQLSSPWIHEEIEIEEMVVDRYTAIDGHRLFTRPVKRNGGREREKNIISGYDLWRARARTV